MELPMLLYNQTDRLDGSVWKLIMNSISERLISGGQARQCEKKNGVREQFWVEMLLESITEEQWKKN